MGRGEGERHPRGHRRGEGRVPKNCGVRSVGRKGVTWRAVPQEERVPSQQAARGGRGRLDGGGHGSWRSGDTTRCRRPSRGETATAAAGESGRWPWHPWAGGDQSLAVGTRPGEQRVPCPRVSASAPLFSGPSALPAGRPCLSLCQSGVRPLPAKTEGDTFKEHGGKSPPHPRVIAETLPSSALTRCDVKPFDARQNQDKFWINSSQRQDKPSLSSVKRTSVPPRVTPGDKPPPAVWLSLVRPRDTWEPVCVALPSQHGQDPQEPSRLRKRRRKDPLRASAHSNSGERLYSHSVL